MSKAPIQHQPAPASSSLSYGFFDSIKSLLRRTSFRGIVHDPAKFFLLLAAIFGLVFVFLFPPFQVIDEHGHYFRAYGMAEGKIVGKKIGEGSVGAELPIEAAIMPGHYSFMFFRYDQKAPLRVIQRDLTRPTNHDKKEFVVFNNTVVYPPVSYLPQVIAMKLSFIFGASPLVSMYVVRLASLVFWITLVYFAIRLLPFGKWALFTLALFPMTLSQAAAISADATINAITFFMVALILHMVFAKRKQVIKEAPWLLLAGGAALALVKLPYVLVLILALAIPKDRFPQKLRKPWFLLMLYTMAFTLVAFWSYLVFGLHTDLRPPDTSVVGQAHYIIQHPWTFAGTLLSFSLTGGIEVTIRTVYGWLGWNDIRLPIWLMLGGFGAFALGLFDADAKKFRISRNVRILALTTFSLASLAITLFIYLTWMPVGSLIIYDLWGRYFIALLPLLVPIFSSIITLTGPSARKARAYITYGTPVALAITTFLIWNRYYFHFPFQ